MGVKLLRRQSVHRCSAGRLNLFASVTLIAFGCVAQLGSACAQSNTGLNAAPVGTVRVDATPTRLLNSFDPDTALGSSIDVLSRTDIDKVFTPHIIEEALS